MAIHLPVATRNAMVNAMVAAADAGTAAKLKIYTGAQHATAGDEPSGTPLAEFTLGDPSFAAASAGSAALTTPIVTVQGLATGVAGCFAVLHSDETTVIFTGTVTATGGGGDLELNTTSITTGVDVDITSGTFTMPSGA